VQETNATRKIEVVKKNKTYCHCYTERILVNVYIIINLLGILIILWAQNGAQYIEMIEYLID
jgi:hypothetical protein